VSTDDDRLDATDDLGWPGDDGSHRTVRRWTPFEVRFRSAAGDVTALLRDISPHGAQLRLDRALAVAVDEEVSLDISGFGEVPCQVRRVSGDTIAVRFELPALAGRTFTYWINGLRVEMQLRDLQEFDEA
jgi:hypothetical protein